MTTEVDHRSWLPRCYRAPQITPSTRCQLTQLAGIVKTHGTLAGHDLATTNILKRRTPCPL